MGKSADGMLVEVIEVEDHPWFVGCQFHPEFTSTPREGHPLFTGFIQAAVAHNEKLAGKGESLTPPQPELASAKTAQA